MQKDPLVALLVGALCVCALFTTFVTAGAVWNIRELNYLKPKMFVIQGSQTVGNALMNDAMEYSKRNPAIKPVIQAAINAAAPKPAAK